MSLAGRAVRIVVPALHCKPHPHGLLWAADIGAPPPAEEARVAGGVDLDNFSSAEQLEKLGLIRLKDALVARGLKCGCGRCKHALAHQH